jgi:protein-tyrosine phosphatase
VAFDFHAFMLAFYRRLPFNNQAYKQLVSLLQNCALPEHVAGVVQYCAVGKNLTGYGSREH